MNSIFNLDLQLLLQAFGLIFITIGAAARLSLWKKWYWRSKSSLYSYVPLGIAFILYSFNDLAKGQLGTAFWVYQLGYAGVVAIGIWWVVRPPAFVKPPWVRWVEAYPPETYEAMRQTAEADPAWESNVTSPEKVKAWARHVMQGRVKPVVE